MSKQQQISNIPDELIMNKVLLIRGFKVMIDSDLAELYGVTTKRLNEQVKRNNKRFPIDFMFQLTDEEKQQVVANCDHLQGLKFSPYLPYVFTEHGAVMLASVLNSERAIQVNLQIVRVFIKMREMLATHKDILRKLDEIERNYTDHDEKIMRIFDYMRQLEQARQEESELRTRPRIGYKRNNED
ncbi:MAG TPA: ORF6N domain-containing protein [Bacteroidales bacterium]|nr:ORF6N domain-containing protein [Bacteroidales bacterium]